jgi:hypothetical protein
MERRVERIKEVEADYASKASIRTDETPRAPHGAILWPEDTDKEGKAWVAPISPAARAGVDLPRSGPKH